MQSRMSLINFIVPILMAVSSPPTVYVSDGSRMYYQKDDGKTILKLEAHVKIARIFSKKINYSFVGNSWDGIYEQNGEKFFVPPGIVDILTATRRYMENPIPGFYTDTLDVFVDKTVKKVIFERYCSQDRSKRRVSVSCLEGNLGGGIENLDFYLVEGFVDPVNIRLTNKYLGKRDFRIDVEKNKF